MKIKREFVLREIAGDILLVPTGKTALDLNGMLTLNGVGADIWKMLPEVENGSGTGKTRCRRVPQQIP